MANTSRTIDEMVTARRVVLVQLPIPPLGPAPIRGNVPLAAAYLKLYAESHGLGHEYDIELFPPDLSNRLGDRALVEELATRPVDGRIHLLPVEHRTDALDRRRTEATAAWHEDRPRWSGDHAGQCLGAGLPRLRLRCDRRGRADVRGPAPRASRRRGRAAGSDRRAVRAARDWAAISPGLRPAFRQPLPDLDRLGSPYLAGILDAADERMLLLETTRGCVFKCKFCYYPKSYDKQYYLSRELVLASLRMPANAGSKRSFCSTRRSTSGRTSRNSFACSPRAIPAVTSSTSANCVPRESPRRSRIFCTRLDLRRSKSGSSPSSRRRWTAWTARTT